MWQPTYVGRARAVTCRTAAYALAVIRMPDGAAVSLGMFIRLCALYRTAGRRSGGAAVYTWALQQYRPAFASDTHEPIRASRWIFELRRAWSISYISKHHSN